MSHPTAPASKSTAAPPAGGKEAAAPAATATDKAADPVLPAHMAPPPASHAELVRWMFSFLRPVKLLVGYACLVLVLWVGAEILAVRQMGKAVDQIKHLHVGDASTTSGFWAWIAGADASAADLRGVMLGLAGLTVAMAVLRYLRETSNVQFSMHMVYFIREAVYDKIQRVGFAFHDAVSTGQLINRALTDLQNVRAFVQTAVLTSLEIVLIVGGYIILILLLNPWVALLALLPLPFWTWYILRFGKQVQPASKDVMEAEDKNVNVLAEAIAGVHVVKAFATERQEIAKYQVACDTFFARVRKRIRLYANFQPVIRTIATASHLSLYLVAGLFIIYQRPVAGRIMEVGDLLILGTAMGSILNRLQAVGMISEQYQNAIVSAKRLYEVLMAPPTVPVRDSAATLPPGPGAVRFEHVSFGYDPAKPVIKDVSFDVAGGSVVAIVGPTGAGKTTLVNLIARFYDPQAGRVVIDGTDIREVALDSLRTQVSFVFQETHLFSDTVEANVAYGRPQIVGWDDDGSDDGKAAGVPVGEVEAAARLAQAHEFVEGLPKKYDTVLAERGASLSGGQKQRLAIARAILSSPRVLVLDDATAAIDPETEDLIRRGMRFVMNGRTTFLIAHRISSVKQADVVIVLEEGRITQMGTHAQLMKQDGHYRDIAAAQLYGDDGPRTDDQPSHMKRMHDDRHVRAGTAAGKDTSAVDAEQDV